MRPTCQVLIIWIFEDWDLFRISNLVLRISKAYHTENGGTLSILTGRAGGLTWISPNVELPHSAEVLPKLKDR